MERENQQNKKHGNNIQEIKKSLSALNIKPSGDARSNDEW